MFSILPLCNIWGIQTIFYIYLSNLRLLGFRHRRDRLIQNITYFNVEIRTMGNNNNAVLSVIIF